MTQREDRTQHHLREQRRVRLKARKCPNPSVETSRAIERETSPTARVAHQSRRFVPGSACVRLVSAIHIYFGSAMLHNSGRGDSVYLAIIST